MLKKDKKTDISHLFPEEKSALIYLLLEKNNLLIDKFNRLERKYNLLAAKLAKNSSNSSKPPSSDDQKPKSNPKKTTSLRKKSNRKPGGQPGHKGKTLAMSETPDEIIVLPVENCGHCGKDLRRQKYALDCRQEFEIPEPKMWVTEYQAQIKDCPTCDYTTMAVFPESITHKTQYGPRAKSMMVYMNQYQLIPVERVSEFLETIYGQKASAGTIVNATTALSSRLDQLETGIKQILTQSQLAHSDETGIRVNNMKRWLHTFSTDQITHYAIHDVD